MLHGLILVTLAVVSAMDGPEKTAKMMDWMRRAGQEQTIKLNRADFGTYVTSRTEYSTVVMFTAMKPERGCAICREAADEFHVLAASIRYTGSQADLGKVFYVTVDYDTHEGDVVFEQMNLSTAPAFYIFPPSKKPGKDDKLDVAKFGFQAEHLAKWVHEQTGHSVSVYRPPNHSSTGFALIFGLSILAVLYVKWDVIGDLCTKDNVSWLLIAACLAFISGQVWNTIRTPQYLMRARGGGIGFIYPSTQNQLVAETHIVLVLYGLMTGGVIMMAKGGEKLDNLGKQRSIMVTGACMLAIGYGLMLNVFKRKYQGYPYSFFLG